MTASILSADDHPLFRQALVMAASNVRKQARVIEAATVNAAVKCAAEADDLKLILLDLKMPGVEGYSGVAMLHAERPRVPILVVSSADASQAAVLSQRFGAVGFIGKDQSLPAIESAIADALAGKRITIPLEPELDTVATKVASMTPAQLRVLLGVLKGRLNKQIAFDLDVTEATVKAHMTSILRKVDVQNRTQAVLAARALGIGTGSVH